MALEKLDSTHSGRVFTWGDNLFGDNGLGGTSSPPGGKLGIGDVTVSYKTVPQVVKAGAQSPSHPYDSNLTNIVAVAAGWDHCMALEKYIPGDPNNKGRVLAWGCNSNGGPYGGKYTHGGRLGDGTTTDHNVPVFVKAGQQNPAHPTDSNMVNIVAIAAGCGQSMMLASDGSVYVTGDNTYGQLGNPAYASSTTPVKVVGFNGRGYLSHIKKISSGYWHCLAIDSNNVAWGWGDIAYLGLGTGGIKYTPCPFRFTTLMSGTKPKTLIIQQLPMPSTMPIAPLPTRLLYIPAFTMKIYT